jgi:hypothetical protein
MWIKDVDGDLVNLDHFRLIISEPVSINRGEEYFVSARIDDKDFVTIFRGSKEDCEKTRESLFHALSDNELTISL